MTDDDFITVYVPGSPPLLVGRATAEELELLDDQKRARLADLARRMRAIAQPVGTLHGFWDVIFDVEALLAGQQPLLEMTPAEWIRYCEDCLRRNDRRDNCG